MPLVNKVTDMSFSNIFARKFVVRLIILFIVSLIILLPAQSITETICEDTIEREKLSVSLELSELIDLEIAKDKTNMYSNIILSQMQNRLENNDFIYNSSAAIYNYTSKELVARSYKIPVILDEDVLSWWRDLALVDVGYPSVSLNNDAASFCDDHTNDTIIISKMYYSNFVLFPTELKAVDSDGNMLDEFNANTPSINQSTYEKEVELKILGNKDGDYAYKEIYDFRFISNDKNETEFLYVNFSEDNKLNMDSQYFEINDSEYKLDIVYQVSFWQGAWGYVVIFELLGILIAAGLAFINTKETFAIYH